MALAALSLLGGCGEVFTQNGPGPTSGTGGDGAAAGTGGDGASAGQGGAGATTSSTSSGGAGTGGAGPECGNSAVEGDEECDDGNDTDTDGCTLDCTIACPSHEGIFNSETKHCYRTGGPTLALTWQAARTHCQALDESIGFDLVAPSTMEEIEWIRAQPALFEAGTYWTGGNDIDALDEFVWTRGALDVRREPASMGTERAQWRHHGELRQLLRRRGQPDDPIQRPRLHLAGQGDLRVDAAGDGQLGLIGLRFARSVPLGPIPGCPPPCLGVSCARSRPESLPRRLT